MTSPLVVAYRDLGFGAARPYLVLSVTGINGQTGLVAGLIDSGADNTVFPAGYAPLMGYTGESLVTVQGTQVGGSVTLRNATKCSGSEVRRRIRGQAAWMVGWSSRLATRSRSWRVNFHWNGAAISW
jgi:hypothetical protein